MCPATTLSRTAQLAYNLIVADQSKTPLTKRGRGRELRGIVYWVLTIAILGPGAGRSDAQDVTNAAGAIAAALRSKNYEEAMNLSRSALQKTPNDPRILTMEGLASSGLGNDGDALRAYQAALKVAPNYVPALEGAAQIEYSRGDDGAAALLERLLVVRPDDPTSHAMLGVLAFKKNDCESAVEHFQKAGEVVEEQAAALGQYGTCLVRLQRPEEAIPLFQKVVTSEPDDAHARYSLAAAEFLAHKSQDSIETLQSLLTEAKPDPEVLALASQAYEDLDKTPEAVKLLHQAITLAPQNPNYYLDFATLSFNHSSYQVGVDMLNFGLTQIPNSAALYAARGILYIQMAEYDKGEDDLETAQRLDPKQSFSSDAQGLSDLQQRSSDKALADVHARLKAHPDDAFLHFLLAEILVQNGAAIESPEFKQAIREGERAAELNPQLVPARDLLGDLYMKTGQTDKVIDESRAALKADPSDQAALYHLVQALRGTDKKSEIPALLKQLATLREATRKNEEAKNRYKLLDSSSSESQ